MMLSIWILSSLWLSLAWPNCSEGLSSPQPTTISIVREAESLLPSTKQEFQESVSAQSVGASILKFVDLRRQQANLIRSLESRHELSPVQRELVAFVVNTIDIPLGSGQESRFLAQVEQYSDARLPPPPWYREQGSEIDKWLGCLEGVIGQSKGALAELSVGLRVKGLVAFNSRVAKVAPTFPGPSHFKELEIDFVFHSGEAWGSVKGWASPATAGMIRGKRVSHRLDQFQQIAQILKNARLPYPKEFHIFFEGGIYESVASTLENQGAIVHGQRFNDHD